MVANQHLDHDTSYTFCRRFLAPVNTLFIQVLKISHQMDLVKVGEVSIDGSKVNANASNQMAMSWERTGQLEDQLCEEVTKLMGKAEKAVDDQSLPEEILPAWSRYVKPKR